MIFKRIIEEGYYYVDKTDLIEDVLSRKATVNLFPRPRRFGKTLNISMLENYFNIKKKKEENKELFKNLNISKSITRNKGSKRKISSNKFKSKRCKR